MAQQFKFNILTGTDAQAKYDAITTKEPFTFYLLQTGVGYLGEKKLFDAASLENTEVTLTGKFFRAVASHVITQADLDNANLSKPDGTAVGDAGILFTADNNDTDDGDELQYFVPVRIPNTVSAIDGNNPGNDIPTATAVVNYITQILSNYVTFEIDGVPGSVAADGSICYPNVYSTDEVRIGTWIDGKPIYRKTYNVSIIIEREKSAELVPASEISTLNIDTCIKIDGQCKYYSRDTETPIVIGYRSLNNLEFIAWLVAPNYSITSYAKGYTHEVIFVYIEYTKTTDNGGT